MSTDLPVLPSGEQYAIRHGDHTAVVTEVGATLRSLTRRGDEVLDGFADEEMCSGGRGQPLLPWPNRIRDGRYRFAGEELELPLSEPPRHNAIHGLTRWQSWRCVEQAEGRVAMEHLLHPQAGYPFALLLRIDYAVSDEGLTVSTTARNVGVRSAPYGAGFHPYLRLGEGHVDPLLLRVAARTTLEADDRGIPTGALHPVAGTPYDFTDERRIGDARLDIAYTDLLRDSDGRARVVLTDPSTGRRLRLWMDDAHPYLMIFTGDGLSQPERRRTGLGVEPMTCAPDAFRNDWGLRTLEPGDAVTSRWGIETA